MFKKSYEIFFDVKDIETVLSNINGHGTVTNMNTCGWDGDDSKYYFVQFKASKREFGFILTDFEKSGGRLFLKQDYKRQRIYAEF